MPRKLTKSQKESVAAKQHFKCAKSVSEYKCPIWEKENEKGSFGEEKYHIDHIIEIADGGTDDLDNLQALCLSCHAVKTKRSKAQRAKVTRDDKKKNKINLQNFLDNTEYVIKTKNPHGYNSPYSPPTLSKYNFIWKPYSPQHMMGGIGMGKQKLKINIDFNKDLIHISLHDLDPSGPGLSMFKGQTYEDFKREFGSILKNKFDVQEEEIPSWAKISGKKLNFILQDVIDKNKIEKLDQLSVNIEYS